MYIILVYDCGEKRVGKMLKLCRQYLNWIQNSDAQLLELEFRCKEIMKREEDSIIIFSSRNQAWMQKKVIGKEKNNLDNFL